MGLDVYLMRKRETARGEETYEQWKGRKIELNSAKYPDHQFKIGYWRSSYNDSGIDSVLESLSMPGLLHLYNENERDDDSGKLMWNERLTRARAMLTEFKNAVVLASGLRVERHINFGIGDGARSTREAMGMFLGERANYRERQSIPNAKHFDSYGCKAGDFWLGEPLKVRAIINGEKDGDIYLIVDAEEDCYDWYIQALEIVVETCEWVLANSTDPDNEFELVYSG